MNVIKITVTGAVLAATAALGACSAGGSPAQPSVAACTAAYPAWFAASAAAGKTTATPPECQGLSQDQVTQISVAYLASQGSSTPVPQASPSASASGPANPVPIVKQAGATTTAVLGDRDVEGDRDASGDLTGGETIDVYTYADADAQAAGEARNQPTDTMMVITGEGFDVLVYATAAADGESVDDDPVFPVPVATIAQRVHGTILSTI